MVVVVVLNSVAKTVIIRTELENGCQKDNDISGGGFQLFLPFD